MDDVTLHELLDGDTPAVGMPPTRSIDVMDGQSAQELADEIVGLTEAMFALLQPAATSRATDIVELAPSAVTTPRPASIALPDVITLEATLEAPTPLATAPVAIRLPDAIPLAPIELEELAGPLTGDASAAVDDTVPASRSMALLQEIAFLDD